jgi:hypothetical protein
MVNIMLIPLKSIWLCLLYELHLIYGNTFSCLLISVYHLPFFSGDTATCLYNSPHEDESLPRVLPGKLLTLDAQCRKDRGTSACFVSSLIKSAKYSGIPILRICLIHRWYSSDFTKDWSMIYLTMYSKMNNLQISLILRYLNVFNYNKNCLYVAFNPFPALTHQSILDLNAACRPKRTKMHWHVRKFKCPLKKNAAFLPMQ